jgi:hypothetical protein
MAGDTSDIFISYKSERRKAAERLAAVLRLHGYSVWFDYQLVKGSDFGFQIDRRIREARAVMPAGSFAANPLGALRRSRQCVAMDGGLLARELQRCAG